MPARFPSSRGIALVQAELHQKVFEARSKLEAGWPSHDMHPPPHASNALGYLGDLNLSSSHDEGTNV